MKFIITIVTFLVSVSAFAFEGVISQTYVNPNTKETSQFTWYIDGNNVRLDINVAGELMTAIPDVKNNALILFGYKAGEDGKYYYMKASIANIEGDVPNMKLLEENEVKYNNQEAKELKLISSKGILAVQYLPEFDFNVNTWVNYFASSYEIAALSVAKKDGFPISSILMTDIEAIYTLKTNSIVEKSVEENTFNVPSNYILFEGVKQ